MEESLFTIFALFAEMPSFLFHLQKRLTLIGREMIFSPEQFKRNAL